MVARRFRVGFVVLTLLVGSALMYAAASGRAASTKVSTAVKISPHVLTADQSGFITATVTNGGPSTVNHVVATVGQAVYDTDGNMTGVAAMPLAASAFTLLPTGCTAVSAGPSSSTVVCDIGQLKPGTARRVLSFVAPPGVQGFNVAVSTTFDESKGTQQTDTVANFDPYPFSTVATTNAAVKGVCTAEANELSASNGNQSTAADPPALGSSFPCTPLTVGVDNQKHPNNIPQTGTFGDISFVDFLGDAGLATVKVSFLSGVPSSINKNNAEIYELAKFPIDLTATDDGSPVPDCVKVAGKLQIPASSNFISCVVRVDNISGGGLMFTLLAEGGDDGGWGGIS